MVDANRLGEVPPLSDASIREALHILQSPTGGLNSDGNVVKSAESALLQWESSDPGSLARGLMNIMKSDDHKFCLMILLIIKNLVHRRWKKRFGRNRTFFAVLSDVEKDEIRKFFVNFFLVSRDGDNDSRFYSRQEWLAAAGLLSKIGRLDLPLAFQELIPQLVQCISTNTESLRVGIIDQGEGAAMILNEVLNELLTKRLLVDKKYFAKISIDLLPLLSSSMFVPSMKYTIESLQSMSNQYQNAEYVELIKKQLRYAKLLSQIVGALLSGGFAKILEDERSKDSIRDVMGAIIDSMMRLLSLIGNLNSDDLLASVNELLEYLSDAVVEVQSRYAIQFAEFLAPFLELFTTIIITSAEQYRQKPFLLSTPFLVSIFGFVTNVISCSEYTPDEHLNDALESFRSQIKGKAAITIRGDTHFNLDSINQVVRIVWVDVFTHDKIKQLVVLVISKFMPISSELLNDWVEDPESYFLSDLNCNAEEYIGASAQSLYLALIESKVGRPLVVPLLLSMINDISAQNCAFHSEIERIGGEVTPYANENILLWDAIYLAIGVSANILTPSYQFEDWFKICLGPNLAKLMEVKSSKNFLPILKRRALWIIGCHANLITSSTNAHSLLVMSLTQNQSNLQNDLAVKLTAASSLISIFYEPTFDKLLLSADAAILIKSLYKIFAFCEELESRRMIMELISLVLGIYCGGELSNEAANAAVIPLLEIWNLSGGHNILRKEVLGVLNCIVAAVGSERLGLLDSIVGPMLCHSLDQKNKNDSMFLIEDALSLWLSILRLSCTYTSTLDNLFIFASTMGMENIREIMLLIEGYIRLGGKDFLQTHSSRVTTILKEFVGEVRINGASYIMKVLEVLLRMYPDESGRLLRDDGVLQIMITGCAKSYFSAGDYECDQVIIYYLTTLARVLITDPTLLDPIFHSLNVESCPLFGYNELMEMYLQKFDSVSSLLWKKVWVVLFIILLPPTKSSFCDHVVTSLDQIINSCVDFLFDEQHKGRQAFLLQVSTEDQDDEVTDIGKRSAQQYLKSEINNDIIFALNLKNEIRTRLNSFALAVGQHDYHEIVSGCEPVIFKQLLELIQ